MVKVDDYVPSCNDKHNFSRRVTLQQWPLRLRPPVAVRGIWNSIGFSWEMTNMCRGDSSSQKRTNYTNVSTDLGMSFFSLFLFSLVYDSILPFVLIKLAQGKNYLLYASFLTGYVNMAWCLVEYYVCERHFDFIIYDSF